MGAPLFVEVCNVEVGSYDTSDQLSNQWSVQYLLIAQLSR